MRHAVSNHKDLSNRALATVYKEASSCKQVLLLQLHEEASEQGNGFLKTVHLYNGHIENPNPSDLFDGCLPNCCWASMQHAH